MKNKRIVFLFRDMGTGGAQKIEAFVANTMVEEGHEVIAVNMASTACTVNISPDIKIVDLDYGAGADGNVLSSVLHKVTYLWKLRRLLVSLKPDLVCAFLSDVVRIAAVAMKGMRIPLIGSERGDPYKFTEAQMEKYRKAYLKCTAAVFQLENVAKKYALPQHVIQRVIPNPCIPRKTDYSVRAAVPEKVIFSAGRLAEQKRFDVLIDAFAKVYQQHPEYKLRIYGDGPLRTVLEEQSAKTCAKEAVTFVGDVEDVFHAAADAEFFVLSSDFEGIPNVLLEAMASGFACVSTDCSPGGARYLLKNGERGLIVPRGDSEALANAMIRMIEDPEFRASCEAAGKEAIDEFAPSEIKKMWGDTFKACL